MKKNQISLLFATVAAAALFCQSAGATTYLVDEFQNYATGNLGVAGTGSSPGTWNASAFNQISVTNGSHSLDGTSLGLVQSYGDKVFITSTNINSINGVPNGQYNKFVSSGTFPPTVTSNLYTSFLYRFNRGVDVSNCMIACMELQSGGIQSGSPSGIDAYWQLFARTNVNGTIQLGIAKNVFQTNTASPYAPGVTNWASASIGVGQTFFVVVRLQINATNNVSTVTNGVDVIDDLWINPAPVAFGTNEANVPTPSVSSPIGDGAVPTSATGPGRFYIVASGANANLDELRIASSWAEVTPPVGQCISANVITDPTNVTQSAEISAILNVGYIGTGATNQWQISGPGSSTWTNIPDAFFPTYVTPNLQLASDSGTKYRCLVGVSCDGSSDTSAVATVTLTAPVVTPPGLIMDDNFSDLLAGNLPITTNNSAWYTSVAANLDASGGGGLVAYTITNTSTLYLGYFVDESVNKNPVDLAVGNEIKVTLSFTPQDFSLFNANGPLRFGLFDYADGGTPVVADDSTVTGSTGNGINVRGYMLSVDFGTNFSSDTPLSLYARNDLSDIGLMSTTGDYIPMDSGPVGGGYTGAPAFNSGTPYTLVFTVARTDVNTCSIGTTITGGGTNWTFTSIDTNSLGYHRFDAFGMRPNSGVTSVAQFTIPEFKVEVLTAPVTVTSPTNITITSVSRSGSSLILGWNPAPAGTYTYSVLSKTNLTDAAWFTNQTGITTTSYTNASATALRGFYRVSSP